MKTKEKNGHLLTLIETNDELSDLIKKVSTIPKGSLMGLDTETTGLDFVKDKIVGYCISFGTKNRQNGFYLPVRHTMFNNLPNDRVVKFIQVCLRYFTSVLFNRNFDFFMLENEGIIIDEKVKSNDVQIICWEATQERYPALKQYYAKYCKKEVTDYADNFAKTIKGKKTHIDPEEFNFANTNPEISYEYAAMDPCITVELYHKMRTLFSFVDVVYPLDNTVAEVLRKISKTELRIDYDLVRKELLKTDQKINNIANEIYRVAGFKFKISSNVQKAEALSRFMTLTEKTDKGSFKMDSDTLEKIDHPLARLFVKFNELVKYRGTYLENILVKEGKPFRVTYSTVTVPTGRLSSGGQKKNSYFANINIHAIPKEVVKMYVHEDKDLGYTLTEVKEGALGECETKAGLRSAFLPPEGYAISSPDFSGEEIRIAANLSGETAWLDTLYKGGDIHSSTAEKIFGKVTKANRNIAKTSNFLMLYGGSYYTLASRLEMAVSETKVIYDKFFQALPKFKLWVEHQKKKSRKNMFCKTYYGRMRDLRPFYNTSDPKRYALGDRSSINSPIQGCIPSQILFEFDDLVCRASCVQKYVNFLEYSKEAVLTNRGENYCYFFIANTGDFLICDNNHKLFTSSGDGKLKECKSLESIGKKVFLSPLQKKPGIDFNVLINYFRHNCISKLFCYVKNRDYIMKSKHLGTLFFIAWLKREGIKIDNDLDACSLRSLASICGYNLIRLRSGKYRLKFTRKRKAKIVKLYEKGILPVASVTIRNGRPIYPTMGFLNKNTGGDVMRIKLVQFYNLMRTNKEFGENVIMSQNVHDEISFAIKYSYLRKAFEIIPKTMSVVNKGWKVPLLCEMGIGHSWGTMIDPTYIDEKGRIVDSDKIDWYEGCSPKERGIDVNDPKYLRVNNMCVPELDYLQS